MRSEYLIKGAKYNQYFVPYRFSNSAYAVNYALDFPGKELIEHGEEYTWLPSRDGDPNGLLIGWSADYGMWTVFVYNTKAPHLRRFQVRWDEEGLHYAVVDTLTDAKVGHAPTEDAAKAIARRKNKEV